MEKGKDYIYSEIEAFAAEKELEIQDYGEQIIGAKFLSLESDYHDNVVGFVLVGVIKFVLVGVIKHEYVYECIYTDF